MYWYTVLSDTPRLNSSSTRFIHNGYYVFGAWEVWSFPLPNILMSFQNLSQAPLLKQRVYNDYMTANLSQGYYKNSYHWLVVNVANDDRLIVEWRFPFHQLFAVQLITINHNSTIQQAQHHKLYSHTGNQKQYTHCILYNDLGQSYAHFLEVSFSQKTITLSCVCAECDDIQWRRNNILLPKNSFGIVNLKKELWPHYSINLKHSTHVISFYNKGQYSCSSVSGQDAIFENSPAYIKGPCKYIIWHRSLAFLYCSNSILQLLWLPRDQ